MPEVGGVGILAWNYRTRIYLSIVKDLGLDGHPGAGGVGMEEVRLGGCESIG
jgi:hypothetical protein